MNILLTGNRGFIGSKLQQKLLDEGNTEVIGYDLSDGLDLLNLKILESHVKKADLVIHMAGEANPAKFYDNVQDTFLKVQTNIYSTHNLAFLCSKHKKKIILASTVNVYGDYTKSIDEQSIPNPNDLYSTSKYSSELIIKGYEQSYGLEWLILRFATVYGGDMKDNNIVKKFIEQSEEGEVITVFNKGKIFIDLIHIDDLVEGVILAIKKFNKNKYNVINLSTGKPVQIIELARYIKTKTKSNSIIKNKKGYNNTTRNGAILSTKAQKRLGWKPKYTWKEYLDSVIS